MRDGRLLGYLLLVPEGLFIVPVINVLWPCRLIASQRDRRGSAIQAVDVEAFRARVGPMHPRVWAALTKGCSNACRTYPNPLLIGMTFY